MVNKDERTKILQMVQEGKITPEEGIQLLDMLEGQDKPDIKRADKPVDNRPAGAEGKWCRIMVSDMDTGRTKVNVRLPLGLINAGVKMGAHFAPEMQDMDFSEFIQAARAGEIGRMVEVDDEDDREHVEIFIE